MPAHPLDQFDVPSRVLKRAQYEAFEFELVGTDVLVRNGSHARPSEHEYVVTIENGLPVDCPCPANERYPYPCKHRTAVAIRSRILTLTSRVQALEDSGLADGLSIDATSSKCRG